jgi:hypothetical protein
MARFRPEEQLATLNRHGVRYVLIGGLAATLHGSNARTADSDICPEKTRANLERLASALVELGARIRTEGVEGGLPFACDALFFEQMALTKLTTDAGDLDVSFEPAGTAGYEDLAQSAVVMALGDLEVPVASLEDVIRSKSAANRPKDRAALPGLQELLRQIRERSAR